jgi:hypothetical protein
MELPVESSLWNSTLTQRQQLMPRAQHIAIIVFLQLKKGVGMGDYTALYLRRSILRALGYTS